VVRKQARSASDINIMMNLDPEVPVDLFEYVAITQYLTELFATCVDVANRGSLKLMVRPYAERDAVYAF
jgi:hypothetical protein